MQCRLCGSNNFRPVIDLGQMPIAHRLLSRPEDAEATFPFDVVGCCECGLVQIKDPIDPAELYIDYNYCFSSWKPQPHTLDELDLIQAHQPKGRVFEIGSNDGMFLNLARERGLDGTIGLELNPHATAIARQHGFTIYNDYLTEDLVGTIVKKEGQFDIVVCRQVLEHLHDIGNFFRCADHLLTPEGYLFIDVPDAGRGLEVGDCSILWEEHVSYFTEPVILAMLERYGFEAIEVRRYNFSGGTIAVLARRSSAAKLAGTASLDPAYLQSVTTYDAKVRAYGERLRETLAAAKRDGNKVVLYGVGCRACTQTNTLPIVEFIDYAVDDQVERQGKYMPGSRLPIRSAEELAAEAGPVLVLLAVNTENEPTVEARIRSLMTAPYATLSVHSPHDIGALLDSLRLPTAA